MGRQAGGLPRAHIQSKHLWLFSPGPRLLQPGWAWLGRATWSGRYVGETAVRGGRGRGRAGACLVSSFSRPTMALLLSTFCCFIAPCPQAFLGTRAWAAGKACRGWEGLTVF